MFDHLVGNSRAKDVLRRMLTEGRVPGALLFAGEDGVGKKLFALELAKAINCLAPLKVEACDKCSSCLRISKSTFPDHAEEKDRKERLIPSEHTDVALARPYNRILRIPLMRHLEQEANFRPFEGKSRVFLIEEADRLNEQSSNALLKTLEEPPPTTHLILLTSRPASLLPTIRSRCQMIRFAPLKPAEVEAHLLKEKGMPQKEARLLASVARGSIGRALGINLETYLQQREAMMDVLDALAVKLDRARLLRASEALTDAKHKDEYEPRLDVLATLVHDVWSLALGSPADSLVNNDLRSQLSKIGANIETTRAARWLSEIERHRRSLDFNINRKVATDALFLSMTEN